MKKYLFILALLVLPLIVFADAGVIEEISGGAAAAAGEDSCSTSGMILSWHMEDADLANEAGCAVTGDTTWSVWNGTPTLSSADKSEGSQSLLVDAATEAYNVDLTQNSSITGRIKVDFRIDSFVLYTQMFQYYYDANNSVWCETRGTAPSNIDIYCMYKGNAITQSVFCGDVVENSTWYRIDYQFDAGVPDDHKLTIYQLDSSSPRQIASTLCTDGPEDSLTDLQTAPDDFFIGNFNAKASITFGDNLQVFDVSGL